MNIPNKAAFLFLTMIASLAFASNPALAHRFNVALVLPPSGGTSIEGQQIREGFMLATAERDAHTGQESDGHLGGLDVYVTVIDALGDIEGVLAAGEIDIVAAFGSQETLSQVGALLDGKDIALLLPGQSPFSEPDQPAVAAFISAYESAYGSKPSAQAAMGYNAARRIDEAVRDQGGAADRESLLRIFAATARDFAW